MLAGVSWAGATSHCPRFESAPEAVRKTVISEARGGTVDEMEILRIEGRTIYIAEIERPADLKIYVEENGSLIRIREDISYGELPEAVRRVIDAENGRLDDVEKQTAGGKTVYFIEIDRPDGVEVNLRLDPDGSVISRREEQAD